MSESQRTGERSPEVEPWSSRHAEQTQVKTEDAPEGGGSKTLPGTPKGNLVQRMKAAVLAALERARAGLSMREDNFFLLLSVIIGLFAGLAVVCLRITND
jgi:hypothetical protein